MGRFGRYTRIQLPLHGDAASTDTGIMKLRARDDFAASTVRA